MAVVSMSKQEFSRLEVLLRVQSGRLRVSDACALIGLRRRQIFRLLRGLKQDGATSLLSKHRGKPSNHRLPAAVRALGLSLVRERYADFGPTLATEKLAAQHGCTVSRETLRGWMMLLLDPTPLARGLVRKKVDVVNHPDGRFAVQFNGTARGFNLFDKIQTVQPGAIVGNKRLSAVLEEVKAQQAAYPALQQRGHAARHRPPNNLEAPGLPPKGAPDAVARPQQLADMPRDISILRRHLPRLSFLSLGSLLRPQEPVARAASRPVVTQPHQRARKCGFGSLGTAKFRPT